LNRQGFFCEKIFFLISCINFAKKLNNMKKIVIIVLGILFSLNVVAQNKTINSLTYKSSAGVRVGYIGGLAGALNLKTFIGDIEAVELISNFSSAGTTFVGLYELHGDLSSEENIKWYLGGGINAGIYKVPGTSSIAVFGLSGVAGIDYKFKDMPINLALDWQPSVQFKKNYGWGGAWITAAVRYTF
jgi:hypothetical protein